MAGVLSAGPGEHPGNTVQAAGVVPVRHGVFDMQEGRQLHVQALRHVHPLHSRIGLLAPYRLHKSHHHQAGHQSARQFGKVAFLIELMISFCVY